MYRVEEIAQWFVEQASIDVNKGGEYLTQLKLQKLLYYAQGFYYAFNDKKLFNEKIIHMPYGPAVEKLLTTLKKYGSNPITIELLNTSSNNLPDNVTVLLKMVYDQLGQYSAYKLVEMTHNETPWKSTKQGQEIKAAEIGKYFKEHYIA